MLNAVTIVKEPLRRMLGTMATEGGEDHHASRGRVLVVDSERAICALVTSVLEDIGYSVVCCATAAEAMRIAREGNIACALIEMMLPDGWGTDAADDIARVKVPVILMSGHPEGVKRGAGRHAFLQKPFGVQELLRAVVDQVVADGLRES